MNHPDNDLKPTNSAEKNHRLPILKYEYGALEPYIDERTMMLHHDIHHGGYVEKLNKALEKFPDYKDYSAIWLLCHLDQVPEEIRTAVKENAGGHVNHSLFWRAMTPDFPGEPEGLLGAAINHNFGSFEKFQVQFEEEGAKLFGSGWVWLVQIPQSDGKLEVITTSGHDNPMLQNSFPLLLNDVWEHAYYLHYESRRPDYLKAWWQLVDWDEVAHRFDLGGGRNEELWKIEEQLDHPIED
jgi:superoxide dismutase, Fe-Mn family